MLHVGISLSFENVGISFSFVGFVWLFVITRLLSVTGSCGASNSNPADSECVLRMIVIKEIKGHLRSHDVS